MVPAGRSPTIAAPPSIQPLLKASLLVISVHRAVMTSY